MECKHGSSDPCDLCAEEDAEHDREMSIQARIDAAVAAERERFVDALADACIAAEIPDSKFESLLIALRA